MIETILKKGKSLQQFETPGTTHVFQNANHYPDFFKHNLVDDSRVIKIFKDDPQANIRVFYYQYLKLCFELDCENVENYINKIEDLITNPEFHFLFPEDQHLELFNDSQFKRLFIEFFDVLNEGNLNVEQALCKYPIADTVLVFFFRTLLIFGGKAQNFDDFIDKTEVFEFLVSYFGIEVNVHQNCLKFVQTDIFVYQENKNQVFMVYIDYEQKNSDIFGNYSQAQRASERSMNDSDVNSQFIQGKKKHMRKKTDQSPIKAKQLRKDSLLSKDGSCIGDFVDFTHQYKQQGTNQVSHNEREERKGVTNMNSGSISGYSKMQNEQGGLKINSKASYAANLASPILKEKLADNTNSEDKRNKNSQTKIPLGTKQFRGTVTLSSVFKDSTAMGNKSSFVNTESYQGNANYKTKLDSYIGDLHQSYMNSNSPAKIKDPSNKVMSATANALSELNNKAYVNQFGYSFGEDQKSKGKNIYGNNIYANTISGQGDSKLITPEKTSFDNYGSNYVNLKQNPNAEIKLKINNQTYSRYQIFQNSGLNQGNQINQIKNQKIETNFDYLDKKFELGSQNLKKSEYTAKPELKYDYASKKGYMKGINITRQFSDTIVLKAVVEPHKSIIENMKNRARAARDSLNNRIKY